MSQSSPVLVSIPLALSLAICAGCGNNPPGRNSPVLMPTGEAPFLSDGTILDLRRDGTFAVQTLDGLEVRRLEGSAPRTLFSVATTYGLGSLVVSRGETVAVASWDQLHTFDGTTVHSESARLMDALITVVPTDLVQISALDLGADGALTVGVTVGGQAGDAPYAQLCTLPNSGPGSCEGIDGLDGYGGASSPLAVVVEGPRTYLLVGSLLLVREGSGAFAPVLTDRVIDLRTIEGGRVAYVHDLGTSSALHILGPDGAEERQVAGPWFVSGHAASGLYAVSVTSTDDGSCSGSWSMCTAPLVWAQLVVTRYGTTTVELGHLDSRPGGELYGYAVLPLPEGGLRIEVDGAVYEFAAP